MCSIHNLKNMHQCISLIWMDLRTGILLQHSWLAERYLTFFFFQKNELMPGTKEDKSQALWIFTAGSLPLQFPQSCFLLGFSKLSAHEESSYSFWLNVCILDWVRVRDGRNLFGAKWGLEVLLHADTEQA